ncbi:integrase core domain-containing protein, partial [Streptomyces sp. NPDC051218]|uniref:integrase core domain-containing protein n=1 Tax=Streptomyces sp. NPDC051218 TaxID=3365645 RepID=UPI0037AE46E4
ETSDISINSPGASLVSLHGLSPDRWPHRRSSLIRDRRGQYIDAFDAVFADVGLRVLKSQPQAPKANAHCERFIGTLRRELLDRTLILNERHLRRTLTRYLKHYNGNRPHRALSQLCPSQTEAGPPHPMHPAEQRVRHTAVLGGLINEDQHAA